MARPSKLAFTSLAIRCDCWFTTIVKNIRFMQCFTWITPWRSSVVFNSQSVKRSTLRAKNIKLCQKLKITLLEHSFWILWVLFLKHVIMFFMVTKWRRSFICKSMILKEVRNQACRNIILRVLKFLMTITLRMEVCYFLTSFYLFVYEVVHSGDRLSESPF